MVMVPAPGEPDCGLDELRNRICESLARHDPLAAVLGALAQGAEDALPGVRVAVFQLADTRLRAYANSAESSPLLDLLDGLEPVRAPWWPLRGEAVRLDDHRAWVPYLNEASAEGVERCWSDLLVTAAGEVVGTLTLFFSAKASDFDGRCRKIDNIRHLAALALEQHHLLEELYFLAQRDALTGLWNRTQLERLLAEALTGSSSGPAVIWLELTGFGRVNSILGSSIGDEILRTAAGRLGSLAGPVDTVARVGGDEFAVLLPECCQREEAIVAAERLQAALSRQYEIQGHSIQLTATAGISLSDSGDDQADLVLRRARMAMECAHQDAVGSLACFEAAMHTKSRDRMELEHLLRQAIPRGELILHYQPQFCLRSGRLTGCEALVRWRQPEIGLVSPAIFIPVAEELGLIVDLGAWVLEEACRQGRRWKDSGHAVRIGVNVSPHQFQAGTLARQVEATLRATGLPPEQLELEITESSVLANLDAAVLQMREIQGLGVTFALDDFGTGQSSLAWLRDLPVQRMKIDRRFLQELDSGRKTPILQSVIGLAHELRLEVIIEGIETEDQFQRIQALGCDELQGFLRGRPVDPSLFARLYLAPSAL